MIKRDSNHTFSRFVVIARYVCHLGTIRSLIGKLFPLVLPTYFSLTYSSAI